MKWRERLEWLNRGGASELEIARARGDANMWSCCAVGENRPALKQRGYTFDYDIYPQEGSLLELLGVSFCEAVGDRNYKSALLILDQIEALCNVPSAT